MSKFTKGKWRFYTSPQPNGCPIIGSDGLMIAMLAHSINHKDQEAEAIANARLIAAAPDLLQALQEVHSWIVCGAIASAEDMAQSFPHIEQVVGAAIAKATGEA